MTQQPCIYLDNSATTPLSSAAKAAMLEAMEQYGNPSSLHTMGQEAETLLRRAREQVLAALGVRPRQGGTLIFTSCGTEATSLALFGCAYAKERRTARHILITDSEHPSGTKAAERLEADGFSVIKISTKGGGLDLAQLDDFLANGPDLLMASLMLVNNETGARYEVEEAFRRIKARYPEAVTHCDAVQGFLKIPFTVSSLGADLITVSGHKLHAPKGVGALNVSPELIKKKKIIPFLVGGGQENGWRSGTENVIGIAAFGGAAADIHGRRKAIEEHLKELYAYAEEQLAPLELRINRPIRHVSHILHLTLPHIKSETALHFLSSKGIYVSSGSACSAHSRKTSSVLLAYGLTEQEADCSLRISFSEYTKKEDIDALAEALAEALHRLVRIK